MGRGGLQGLNTPPRPGGKLSLVSSGEAERLWGWAELGYHNRGKKEEAT